MGKSKLGSPFKLKNQGVGGAIGTGVAASVPSILGVLKLKYPDAFTTPEEKLKQEELKLKQKMLELEEKKLIAAADAAANELKNKMDFEKYKAELEDKIADENRQQDLMVKRQEMAAEEMRPSTVAKKVVDIETGRKLVQEREQSEQLFAGKKVEQDLNIAYQTTANQLADLELQVKTMTKQDDIDAAKVPMLELRRKQAEDFNNMYEFMASLDQQEFENMMAEKLYNLKVIDAINDVEYKKQMLTIKAVGSKDGMSSVEQNMLRTWMQISSNWAEAFATAPDKNSQSAIAALSGSNNAALQANQIMVKNGLAPYQMDVIKGIDKKGNLLYEPSNKVYWEQIPDEEQPAGQPRSYNFQSPNDQLDAIINMRRNINVEPDEYGNYRYIPSKKKVNK